MIYGISGAPIPVDLPYASIIQKACEEENFPPCLAYAIAWRESISGQVNGFWDARTVLAVDGGHGLFQLTSSFPEGWDDEAVNVRYALSEFLVPSMKQFAARGVGGEHLIRLIAAAFNAGEQAAWLNHLAGNVDLGTTGNNYASEVAKTYYLLVQGRSPAGFKKAA